MRHRRVTTSILMLVMPKFVSSSKSHCTGVTTTMKEENNFHGIRSINSVDIKKYEHQYFTVPQITRIQSEELVGVNDAELIGRYLIACKGNEMEAIKRLKRLLEWREMHLPVNQKECVDMLVKGIFYVRGMDKEDRPLFVVKGRLYNKVLRNESSCSVLKDQLYL